jgi:peptidoglycan/LPS O-acetylase OafA/YrhL
LSSYSLYLTHGPIVVVCEKVMAGRVQQGVPVFVVSLVLVVPLTIVFARVFASVFETPFRRHRRAPLERGREHASLRQVRSRLGLAR